MSGAASTPAEIAQIVAQLTTAMTGIYVCRFSNAAATAIYLYGIFTSLSDEVKYFWSSFRWTLPNILYIINRYVCIWFFLILNWEISGLHGDFSTGFCRNPLGTIGIILAQLAWTGIMTLRVVALWRAHRLLVSFIWCLWLITMGSITILTVLIYLGVTERMTYNSYIRMCSTPDIPKLTFIGPVPQTVYELFLTALTVVKTYQFAKTWKQDIPPLMLIMTRDGLFYFVMGAFISVANMFAFHFLSPNFCNVLMYIYWALLSTFTAQLTLNLRKAFQGDRFDSSTAVDGVSAHVSFAAPRRNAPSHALSQEQGTRLKEPDSGVTRFIMGEGEFAVDPYPILSADLDDVQELETLQAHTRRDLEVQVRSPSRLSRQR